LSLTAPENVQFKYRLEGVDDDWVEAGAQRRASYPQLPAGDYQFRVIACNNSGVWNETGATL
jgi:Y_Y_Y domain